ncbi:hypothetical protein CYLTODRAFT_456071 [Cylindrobasidium torrendii FP15055 ss-10]|uniref:Uncharacterized protein n=1 Tax=Cylindrobasidium torrendii FP15055 ss-10 TaxID=1314674 RepID=A0A0D7B5D4_9AGAR|nr:hypothetical protein CYLTODRAFT_456071 [Cylindrobasidium torrendii FP15055 ss-10]
MPNNLDTDAVRYYHQPYISAMAHNPVYKRLVESNDTPPPNIEKTICFHVKDLEGVLAGAGDFVATNKQKPKFSGRRKLAWRSRSQVESFVSGSKAVLNPVRRLPVERLEIIFELCAERTKLPQVSALTYLDPHTNLFLTGSDLWALGATCRRWRSVVLGRPGLWSNIRIDINEAKIGSEYYFDRLVEHLNRANNALHVTIGHSALDTDICCDADKSISVELLEQLTPYLSGRVEQLNLFLPLCEARQLADFCDELAPSLRCVQYSGPKTSSHLGDLNWMWKVNNLTCVRLYNIQDWACIPVYRDCTEFVCLNSTIYDRVTETELQDDERDFVGLDVEDVGVIISGMELLQRLKIDVVDVRERFIAEPENGLLVTGHNLVNLDIAAVHWSSSILANIVTPVLEHLRISVTQMKDWSEFLVSTMRNALPDIVALIQRSKCTLRGLSVQGVSANAEELSRLFKSARNIETLCLYNYPEMMHVFELLEDSDSTKPCVLPHLRTLKLQGPFESWEDSVVLFDRIASRWSDVQLDDVVLHRISVDEKQTYLEEKDKRNRFLHDMNLRLAESGVVMQRVQLDTVEM